MESRKSSTFLADIFFLAEMTFVIGFPNPSNYKAFFIIVFFTYMTIMSIIKTNKIGTKLQCLWAIAFWGFCRLSALWSIYPKEIEGVISNVQWSLMISLSTANYVRIYKLSFSDLAKRIFIGGIVFAVDILLNGTFIEDRYTVIINQYMLNENVFGTIAVNIAAYMILWSKKHNWKSLPINAMLILMLIMAMISGSRKCLIAAVIYIILFLLYEYPPQDILVSAGRVVLVLTLVGVAYWSIFNVDFLYSSIGIRIETLFEFLGGKEDADGSALTRKNMIEYAFEMFKERPLTGHGLNIFQKISGYGAYAHNNYLELLANVGAIGCLIYYIPILFYLKKAAYFWKNRYVDSIFPLSILLFFVVNDFANVSYFSMPNHLFLGLVIGMCVRMEETQ